MPREKTAAADFVAFPVRLPPDLLDFIRDQAAEDRRPVNTQIIMLLEKATKIKKAAKTHEHARTA